ncbi:MAG: helix-turn-helix domain-containing protein [Kofleriaceae bacterium]|nr:helix-turn-helix domain-containing protein [Kofleriaceae bacterium]
MSDPSRATATWPPYLTARRAMAYTGRSRNTINRAVAAGKLSVYGRPGGARGERVFRREDLDRWLAGGGDAAAATPPAEKRATTPPAVARTVRRAAGDISSSDAIARINRAAGGGR